MKKWKKVLVWLFLCLSLIGHLVINSEYFGYNTLHRTGFSMSLIKALNIVFVLLQVSTWLFLFLNRENELASASKKRIGLPLLITSSLFGLFYFVLNGIDVFFDIKYGFESIVITGLGLIVYLIITMISIRGYFKLLNSPSL